MPLCWMPVLVLLDLFLRSLNLLPTSRNERNQWTRLPIKLGQYYVAFSLVNSDVNRVSWMSLCVQWLCLCINITHSCHGSLLVVLVINKRWLMFEFVIQGLASPSLYYFTLNVSFNNEIPQFLNTNFVISYFLPISLLYSHEVWLFSPQKSSAVHDTANVTCADSGIELH